MAEQHTSTDPSSSNNTRRNIVTGIVVCLFVLIALYSMKPALKVVHFKGFQSVVRDVQFTSDDTLIGLDEKGDVYQLSIHSSMKPELVASTNRESYRLLWMPGDSMIAVGHLDGTVDIIDRDHHLEQIQIANGSLVTESCIFRRSGDARCFVSKKRIRLWCKRLSRVLVSERIETAPRD
jgi:hypothetical protein